LLAFALFGDDRMNSQTHKPKLALALGAGAARGWAHVGVIRALEARGIKPDIICGTSMGALVGAAYASGELDRFESWVKRLTLMDVVSFMDVSLNGGLIKGEKLMAFFERTFVDRPIENLKLPFAAVACDLLTGAETWLQKGSTADAVRASIALPGLLTPVHYQGKTLVDGGLVNPVPVSLARAMGADMVLAVDLNADLIGRHLQADEPVTLPDQADARAVEAKPGGDLTSWLKQFQQRVQEQWSLSWPSWGQDDTPPVPSLFDVVASSINIMQVRITRSRMAGDPPDLVIAPRLADLGLMDFHKGEQTIEEGRLAVERSVEALAALF
jgi:NTE family protein